MFATTSCSLSHSADDVETVPHSFGDTGADVECDELANFAAATSLLAVCACVNKDPVDGIVTTSFDFCADGDDAFVTVFVCCRCLLLCT